MATYLYESRKGRFHGWGVAARKHRSVSSGEPNRVEERIFLACISKMNTTNTYCTVDKEKCFSNSEKKMCSI